MKWSLYLFFASTVVGMAGELNLGIIESAKNGDVKALRIVRTRIYESINGSQDPDIISDIELLERREPQLLSQWADEIKVAMKAQSESDLAKQIEEWRVLFEKETCLGHHKEEGLSRSKIPGGSKLIQRTLAEYEKHFKEHRLLLFAGHCGAFSGRRFGRHFTNDMSWYAVDMGWHGNEEPDAVLDINNAKDMSYFPNEWADEIFSDDRSLVEGQTLKEILRILKRDGVFFVNLHEDKAIYGFEMVKNDKDEDHLAGFEIIWDRCDYMEERISVCNTRSNKARHSINENRLRKRLGECAKEYAKRHGFSDGKVIGSGVKNLLLELRK